MAGVDTSRTPKGELAAKDLIDAVVASDDRVERHYLEIKSTLDLATKKDQAKLAKFILGAANRMPDRAATAFEGHGVMVIGASTGSVVGVPPIEALEIQKAVLPFIGADGPRYDLVRVPVPGSDNEVLVFLVDPPEWGQGPFICQKSGDGGLRDGAVFVRADGETREARADELKQLLQRGQTSTTPIDFAVRVVGVVRPIEINNDETLEEYISLHRSRLRAGLENEKSPPKSDVTSAGSAEVTLPPAATEAARKARALMRSFTEPESRSEEEYFASIDDWEQHFRDAWPEAVLRLIGGLGKPVEVEVTNREKTFFHDVQLKVHLGGDVHGTENWDSSEGADFSDLGIPEPPRVWGPTNKFSNMVFSGASPVMPYGFPASNFHPRATWKNSESVDWEFSVGQLRPRGVDVSDDEDLVLYTLDSSMTSVDGTWQITARDHHDVYTGTLAIEIGEPLDLTKALRIILGLE